MTLREKAQNWLDDYKKTSNGAVVNMPSPEVIAAVFAEYLREYGDSAKKTALEGRVELLHEDLMTEQGKTAELEKRIKELEFQLAGAENRVLRLEGENSAYRFAIRCNGMSGAEVHT